MYAIVRNDLHMTPGKIASQAGHAFVGAFLEASQSTIETLIEYQESDPGTKVVLQGTLEELEDIYKRAQEEHIPSTLIIDSNHIHPPDFNGQPIVTAVGIGPIKKSDLPELSVLKLL